MIPDSNFPNEDQNRDHSDALPLPHDGALYGLYVTLYTKNIRGC